MQHLLILRSKLGDVVIIGTKLNYFTYNYPV